MPSFPEPAPEEAHALGARVPPSPVRGVRFPLSAKILLWFFLNLAFLGAVAWIFARVQLRLGLDSLLAGPASERVQTMAEVLTTQLNERGPIEWPGILQKTAEAYHMQVALYRNDSRRVAGVIAEPPEEVLKRITDARQRTGPPDGLRDRPPEALRDGERRDRGADGRPAGDPAQRPPREDERPRERQPERLGDRPPRPEEIVPFPRLRNGEAPPPGPPAPGGFPKSMLRTSQPPLYWVLIRLPVVDRTSRPPMPTTLLLATDSLRGGGLLFDFRPWLVGGLVVLAISALLWLPLVAGITRALRQMTGAAEAIAQGRFDTHVNTPRADELGRLGTSLNHMAERLREFFTGQKRFLGDIAHELCSPLARMEMALGILDQRADDKQRAYVADVREELRHMSELVHELLSFSKAGVGGKSVELKPVPLAALAGRVVAREAKERGGVIVDLPASLTVLAEPELLARALGNVIRNALRYASPANGGTRAPSALREPASQRAQSARSTAEDFSYRPAFQTDGQPAGPITVSARETGTGVILSVTDSGPGVPEDALHRLFDPFFRPESARTRETGGAGLGLAIVKSCVEACEGTVTARNVAPHGLQVDFALRRVQGQGDGD